MRFVAKNGDQLNDEERRRVLAEEAKRNREAAEAEAAVVESQRAWRERHNRTE